ncbi:phosphatase PAP2 family protein [Terrabacter sp. NPDC000476]|uniref:phosphatase PAP2 family protein n=1 Tax=Terrabacter sp. NPDC000476 TaxID=3154258 RepID=UPI003319B44D
MNPSFVHRYEVDPSRPSVGSALRDAALRVLAPAVVLFGLIVGLGFLILGPLGNLPWEEDLSRSVAAGRTATMNSVTAVWSHIGNTEIVIGVCVVVVALVWWRTKQWWYAVVPAIAIAAQASVFVAATTLTDRKRPAVEHLDPAPPTSSYPSGHMGASTALYLTFALMAQRIERAWLRRLVTVVCAVVPLLVGYARLYRGMHHLVDILVGMVNGVVCALLAWNYLRRKTS